MIVKTDAGTVMCAEDQRICWNVRDVIKRITAHAWDRATLPS